MIVKNMVSDNSFYTEKVDNVQQSSAAFTMMQETRIDGLIVAEIKTEKFLCIVSQPGIDK